MITGTAKVAGVVGWPVKHSLSPLIHNAWIEALGLDAVYERYAVSPDTFETQIYRLRADEVIGVNVTMPHKHRAFDMAMRSLPLDRPPHEIVNARAWFPKAANLLIFDGGNVIYADNTDGLGMLSALSGVGWEPEKGPALVLGSGGAADAALSTLLEAGVPEARAAARRFEPATLFSRPQHWLTERSAATYSLGTELDEALEGVTAVINATSAGLNGVGELPAMEAAPPGAVFMDMVYSPLRTKFLRDAAARGHPTVDGLSMLIGQARPSFEAFFGVPPPPPEVVDVRALCLKALGEAE